MLLWSLGANNQPCSFSMLRPWCYYCVIIISEFSFSDQMKASHFLFHPMYPPPLPPRWLVTSSWQICSWLSWVSDCWDMVGMWPPIEMWWWRLKGFVGKSVLWCTFTLCQKRLITVIVLFEGPMWPLTKLLTQLLTKLN